MRSVTFLLAAAMLSGGVVGAEKARAERPVKDRAVTMRLASQTARPGFTQMAFDNGVLYVSQRGRLGPRDVVSADIVTGRESNAVAVTFTPEAARRLSAMSSKRADGGLAVIIDGRVAAFLKIRSALDQGRAMITGLAAEQADAIVSAFGRDAVDDGLPRISLVASSRSSRAGDLITVDVYVRHVSDLRGYQVALDAEGGTDGSLDLDRVTIDAERDDYVFNGLNAFQATDDVNRRVAAALMNDSVDTDGRAYLGSFTFRATSQARGIFRIGVRMNQDTAFLDSHSQQIDVRAGADARVSIR